MQSSFSSRVLTFGLSNVSLSYTFNIDVSGISLYTSSLSKWCTISSTSESTCLCINGINRVRTELSSTIISNAPLFLFTSDEDVFYIFVVVWQKLPSICTLRQGAFLLLWKYKATYATTFFVSIEISIEYDVISLLTLLIFFKTKTNHCQESWHPWYCHSKQLFIGLTIKKVRVLSEHENYLLVNLCSVL